MKLAGLESGQAEGVGTYVAISESVLSVVGDELVDLVVVDVSERGRVVEELHAELGGRWLLFLVGVHFYLEVVHHLHTGQHPCSSPRALTLAGQAGKKRI